MGSSPSNHDVNAEWIMASYRIAFLITGFSTTDAKSSTVGPPLVKNIELVCGQVVNIVFVVVNFHTVLKS